MNQILVTEKLYITPELKRKKNRYKIIFFISVFSIFLLFSYYIYAEYDRDKSEKVSKTILSQITTDNNSNSNEDNTVRNVVNDVLVIALDATKSDAVQNEITTTKASSNTKKESNVVTYQSDDGTSYTIDAELKIPSLDIDYPVISETSTELLKISLNKYWGPEPNTVGNYCIVGHNYANGKMFGKLYQMQIGDIATLTDNNNKTVQYEAYSIYIVEPDDVSCTSQLTGGKRELTLITCSNYATQRRVIKCREI